MVAPGPEIPNRGHEPWKYSDGAPSGRPPIGVVRERFRDENCRKGRITVWEPPSRLVFDWRAVNFATDEKTEVEVTFQRNSSGTLVTVTHRGWSRIRADHPVRHDLETSSFIGMIGLWWGDLMSSLRDYSAESRHVDG